jgi:hypothetical protein
LEADVLPPTEEGDNWTVAVFNLPRRNWTKILKSLLAQFDKNEGRIPHYKIMFFDAAHDSFKISFRVLRRQENEGLIKARISETLSEYQPLIDPPKHDQHHWIEKGQRREHWTLERCQVLNKLSRFVLEIIDSETVLDERYKWLHLFANMSAIFQIKEKFWTAETFPRWSIATHPSS